MMWLCCLTCICVQGANLSLGSYNTVRGGREGGGGNEIGLAIEVYAYVMDSPLLGKESKPIKVCKSYHGYCQV